MVKTVRGAVATAGQGDAQDITRLVADAVATSGMTAGIATVLAVWLGTPIAWTWHALIGATVTVGIALMVAPFVPASQPAAPAATPA